MGGVSLVGWESIILSVDYGFWVYAVTMVTVLVLVVDLRVSRL
jgi:hypothetical protein